MLVQALSESQIAKIHESSVRILDRTGFILPHPETRDRLVERGARVDKDTACVHLPQELITKALESAQRHFTIYGRDGTQCASFGTDQRNYNSIAGEAYWVDKIGGERREATLSDVAQAAQFVAGLKNINEKPLNVSSL